MTIGANRCPFEMASSRLDAGLGGQDPRSPESTNGKAHDSWLPCVPPNSPRDVTKTANAEERLIFLRVEHERDVE